MAGRACPLEETEQEAVIRWATGQLDNWPELALLYHVPNGGKRGKRQAAALKRQGVNAGVPDLVLPVPRGGFHGLYIELKRREGGRVSSDQAGWIRDLTANGYRAVVRRGWEEAVDELRDYLAADGPAE